MSGSDIERKPSQAISILIGEIKQKKKVNESALKKFSKFVRLTWKTFWVGLGQVRWLWQWLPDHAHLNTYLT